MCLSYSYLWGFNERTKHSMNFFDIPSETMTRPCLPKIFSHMFRHYSLLILLSWFSCLWLSPANPIIILCSPHEPPLPFWSDSFWEASAVTPTTAYCIRISYLFFKLRTSEPELILPVRSPSFTSCPTSPLSLTPGPFLSVLRENLGGSKGWEACPISSFSFRCLDSIKMEWQEGMDVTDATTSARPSVTSCGCGFSFAETAI